MIRWLMLASQSSGSVSLRFSEVPGADVSAMADCLESIGAKIVRKDGEWTISGVGERGFEPPKKPLDCGNSGTTARFLMAMVAGIGENICIDGDDSLRGRDMSIVAGALRDLGCSVSGDSLPLTVQGPIKSSTARIDLSSSSQPLSAMLLASPSFPFAVKLETYGKGVSRGYFRMSLEIAKMCGSENHSSSGEMHIVPWEVSLPDSIKMPTEDSLLPIAMLISELHGAKLKLNTETSTSPAINCLMEKSASLDLRDESDLICPASVLMAIGNGGKISGAAHSRGKESNRVDSTLYLLRCFGMDAKATMDGLEIPGNQSPSRPKKEVDTHLDHRLAMTAMVLSSKFGGSIMNPEICSVSDPGFINRLLQLGA
jgi:3-phosphoshikimate 1-carboxyvinyltransferase